MAFCLLKSTPQYPTHSIPQRTNHGHRLATLERKFMAPIRALLTQEINPVFEVF